MDNTYTRKQFLNWIKSQPDDRAVKMGESTQECETGCLLLQFAREKVVMSPEAACSFASIRYSNYDEPLKTIVIDNIAETILDLCAKEEEIETFGDVKKILF